MPADIIRLDALKIGSGRRRPTSDGGCAASGCGAGGGPADMPRATWEKVKDHPCFAEEAHHYFARMHVAVAPACNMQCNYCNRRFDCANESRPGVVSERLTPDEAARKVKAVARAVPQLSVLGIAGPGDGAYDWAKTRETFARVAADLPDLKLCLSTNGLALPEHVDELKAMNVAHVTVTINMVDPQVGAAIYPWIFHDHRRRTGLEASRILHERQMESLERLVAADILVKVNSVLIPGINADHLADVHAAVTARGAFLHNIMPLIARPEHGTVFGLEGRAEPDPAALQAVQDRCGSGARLMRHCRQCRADAIGMLGEDRGQDFTLDRLAAEDAPDDPAQREAYRAWVEVERADRHAAVAAAQAAAQQATGPARPPWRVAVCTKGGGRINAHFGKTREFQIYDVDARGVRFVAPRRLDSYCVGGRGDAEAMASIIDALADVQVILCERIGDKPKRELAIAGITAIDTFALAYIEAAIADAYACTGRAEGTAGA
ncbi:MAG: nitrogenase cofactor biosynthesis protein NifB [Alphaproteobacteria bacterium]